MSFQLKTFAIEPIVLPQRPHTSDRHQSATTSRPHPSRSVGGRTSSIFKSPRPHKEGHIRNGTLVLSPSTCLPSAVSKSSKPQTHCALEPVDFDPFEDAESFHILIQDPEINSQQRHDLVNMREFRSWLSNHFPRVVDTIRSLRLLPARAASHHHVHDDQDGHVDDKDLSDSGSDKEQQELHSEASYSPATRAASLEAWQLLFRHAKLQVFAPNDHVVIQDATRSGSVFFVLNGSCELRFQPKFLDFLLTKRKANALNSQFADRTPPSPPRSPVGRPYNKKKASAGTRSLNHHAPGLPRKLSLSHLTEEDAHEVSERGIHLKTLGSGGFFGLDAALFEFPSHTVTAISHGALQRSAIGLTTRTCMHVLRLPVAIFQQIRAIVASPPRPSLRQQSARSLFFFPYAFSQDKVEFLRQTFVFQSMRESSLQFLASHLRFLRIPRHEYLFTPGQHVAGVFLVKSGQLKVAKPYQIRSVSTGSSRDQDEGLRDGCLGFLEPAANRSKVMVETRNVELEILQTHDAIGLHEVCLMRPQFTSHCIAMSDDVELFALSAFALFATLTSESAASGHVVENLTRHHAWTKVREYAALNHHSSEKEAKLSLAVQQRGPIQCSRCGWAGHVSTSSICVRAESPRAMLSRHASSLPSSQDDGGTGKAGAGIGSPMVQLPLTTRSSRTQQRLSSLVMVTKLTSEGGGTILDTTMKLGLDAKPPANELFAPASSSARQTPPKDPHALSTAIVHADSQLKASMLRGLLPFLCMGRTTDLASSDCEHDDLNGTGSELERALRRLDGALVDEAKQLTQSNHFTPLVRPQTEGNGTRRRAGGVDRGSQLNIAAVQAVGRMSTAAAATMDEAQVPKAWPAPLSASRSPRSSSHPQWSSSLKKPEHQIHKRALRRNAANL